MWKEQGYRGEEGEEIRRQSVMQSKRRASEHKEMHVMIFMEGNK